MRRKIVSGIMLTLLLISMLTLAFNIQPAKGWTGTVYIRADGSIDPPDAPITTYDNVTHTLTDDITSSADGIVVERDNIVIDGAGYTLQGTGEYESKGIDLSGRSNVTIKNTTITTFYSGIRLYDSNNNTISGDNIANNFDGVLLERSDNNTISGNNITANNDDGIWLYWFSSNNMISGNNIANNKYGILLDRSSDNTVSGNVFVNDGLSVYYSFGNVVVDNIVNGRPLIYLENVQNYRVDDAGQAILVKSKNITVEGLNLSKTDIGIQLWQTNNTTMKGNNITANNNYGIYLEYSFNNTISGNNIANNGLGIYLKWSSNNVIYHNNFIDNLWQALDIQSVNTWDDGYPSGGNYWSDHVCTGNPSNGSQPYIIDANNVDHYPFQDPNGWLLTLEGDINGDGIVSINDVVIAALAFGSYPGHPNWNPVADLNNDGVINIIDLFIIGANFGKTDC